MDKPIEPNDLIGHIFKIQTPLDHNGDALFYNKDKSIEFLWPIEDVVDFMGKEYKKFASFHFSEDDEDVYLKEEKWQKW